MSSKANGSGHSAMKEIPFDKIQDVAKTYEHCVLRVTRRNQKGQMQTVIPNWERPVLDMLDIEQHLINMAGGGHFRVEMKNPKVGVEPVFLVPPFMVNIEAPPKPVALSSDAPAGFVPGMPGMPAGFGPPAVGGGMAWGNGLSPAQQQSYFGAMPNGGANMWGPYGPPPPWARPNNGNGTTRHMPDEIALRQVADLKEELGKLREEAKAERAAREADQRRWEERQSQAQRDHERELAKMREEREREREAARERERDEDRRRSEERYRELQLQMMAPKKSVAEELAPLLERLTDSRGSRADHELQLQLKMMEMQQQGAMSQMQMMQAMFLKAGNGDKETYALLKEVMNQKSPEMQAALINQMLEMQITSVGAMANLVKETMPDQPPVWLQAILGGLDKVGSMAEEYIQSRNEQPVQRQMHQMPAPPAPRQFVPPASQALVADEPHVVVIDATGAPAPDQPPAPTPAPVESAAEPSPEELERGVNEAMNLEDDAARVEAVSAEVDKLAPLLPADFHTVEWRTILIELHVQRPPERVAHILTRQLSHLIEFRGLPQRLSGFLADPTKTLQALVGWLPIWNRDRAYCEKVIELTVGFLAQEGYFGDGAAGSDGEAAA